MMRHVHRTFWIFAACVGAVSLTAQGTSPRYTIAFKAFPPSNTDIFIAAGDGSNARPLAPDRALDYNAAFSADGRWIIFTSHRAGSADLYRIRPDGTGLERLTDDPGFDDQGAFSPDGKRLAFVSTRRGQADIWTLDMDTRKTQLVVGDLMWRDHLCASQYSRPDRYDVLRNREISRARTPRYRRSVLMSAAGAACCCRLG